MTDITNNDERKSIKPLEYYNMSDFLKGQASRIFTNVSRIRLVMFLNTESLW